MNDLINLIFDEDGVAREYDDTYDITIHCESQEEQDAVLAMLNRRWIPCSERLPEFGHPVLWCNEKGGVFISAITVQDDISWAIGKRHRFATVIAWMPLPEPYKGE